MVREEQQVREVIRTLTPYPEVAIDVEQVRQGAKRRASRRAVLAASAAVIVVAGGIGVATRGDRQPPADPSPTPEPHPMEWQRAPDMPLSPRWEPFTIWTGSEFLVIGGLDRDFVGGPAPFPSLRDGAAYDPDTSSWRRIADAPTKVGDRATGPGVLVGDTVVITQGATWVAYDVPNDRWRVLPQPPADIPQPVLAADPAAGLLYVMDKYVVESDAPVQVLDLDDDTWSQLPASTIQPQLDDRSLVTTDVGLVVIGDDLHPRQAGKDLEKSRAELWDGQQWTRYPDSDLNGGGHWTWTGERVISTIRRPAREAGPSSQVQYTAGALDPDSGQWAALPFLPNRADGLLIQGWPRTDGLLVFQDGYIYDDETGASVAIPTPAATLGSSGVELGDGRLMTFGGYHFDPSAESSRVTPVTPSNEAWMMVVEDQPEVD